MCSPFSRYFPAWTLPRDGWRLPSSWQFPIVAWALTLSFAWPVMIVREAGLRLGTLRDTGALDSWALLTTPQVESWILYVAITQLMGILWLDWLFGPGFGIRGPEFDSDRESAIPNPVHGLWIGATLASIVAVVQGTIAMSFLNAEPWIGLRRAAGTMLDMFLPRRGDGGYERYRSDGEFHMEAKVALQGSLNRRQDRDRRANRGTSPIRRRASHRPEAGRVAQASYSRHRPCR